MTNPVLAPLRFPQGIFRLLYWVFFKPTTLDRYIRQFDPELKTNASWLTLWRHGKTHPELRALVGLALCDIVLTTWIISFLVTGLGSLIGFRVNWLEMMMSSTMCSVIYGLISGSGIVDRVISAAAFGGIYGMVWGVPRGWNVNADYTLTRDLVFGMVSGVIAGAAFSVFATWGAKWAWALGVVLGVIFGLMRSVPIGVVFTLLFWISYFRLPLYIFELPFSLFLGWRGARLQRSPVYWDELIWLPLWGLDRQIIRLARRDRPAALAAVNHVAQSFRQGWAAQIALLELSAQDIAQAQTPAAIAALAPAWAGSPDTKWTGFQQTLGEIAASVQTALTNAGSIQRQAAFRQALADTRQLRQSFYWSQHFAAALLGWETVFERESQS